MSDNTNNVDTNIDESMDKTNDAISNAVENNEIEVIDIDIKALQSDLATAETKANEHWELYLSARAEADNIRKRAERDVASAHKFALDKFIPELLTVKDSLELGTKAARDSAENSTDHNEQLMKFIEGSDMTIKLFMETLKKFGVEIVCPDVGELLNPEFHQAMTMVPNPDLPANAIVEVIQPGYTLNGRLLRPAMVIVSSNS